jgi:predicted nuclease of predicted toxin-antitoxin system
VKLLVDMNLSPGWTARLARHGLEAVHWSAVGAATAPDEQILGWAREHGFVLITNDLDFSTILAATSGRSPSVVQVRMQDLLSDAAVSAVVTALDRFRTEIDEGALLSVDETGTRVRMLPLRRISDT